MAYVQGDAKCDSNKEEHVERLLQLGVQCEDSGDELFVHSDLFLECGPRSKFDILEGSKFTCSQPISVPAFDTQIHTIPAVEIFTDYRWPQFTNERCYKFSRVRRRELGQRAVDVERVFSVHASAAPSPTHWTISATTGLGLVALMYERLHS